ncbi:hypothetical protein LCGC14_0412120 [marine sediment metagenome]|uniref:Uncharacterized protein n=1 Tax=marine sediment metagenome TaxID=412755 RepID=A0A0F9VFD5_9ZZZZ
MAGVVCNCGVRRFTVIIVRGEIWVFCGDCGELIKYKLAQTQPELTERERSVKDNYDNPPF